MSDPQNSDIPQPPAYGAPAPGYAAAPAYAGPPATPTTVPGKTLGIVAFVLSFFAQLIALILGIVALVQSRKAGVKNGFALAAVIISSVLIVVGIIVAIVLISVFASTAGDLVQFCLDNPAGVYEVNGQTITCGG
ncbi:DUF4190 domain-containing protein [Microbacterium sp.]|uniref:DUF4190 domain-containing protein n=1 Tax=Microbacterium sp. TaxID=51671 RepID=UPI0025DB3189|nr:DUF4190 domain-containing protein [Microbacterium sp.]